MPGNSVSMHLFLMLQLGRKIMLSVQIVRGALGTAFCLLALHALMCAQGADRRASGADGKTTVAEAQAFMKRAEDELQDMEVKSSRASWVQQNFITDDTEILSAEGQEKLTAVTTQLALEARRFDGLAMPAELARKFKLLKLSLAAPAPNNDAERKELTTIASSLESDYGRAKYCVPRASGSPKCRSVNDLNNTLGSSSNPEELLDAWVGWHTISAPMRQRYARFVDL